jgi:hypothetical protein
MANRIPALRAQTRVRALQDCAPVSNRRSFLRLFCGAVACVALPRPVAAGVQRIRVLRVGALVNSSKVDLARGVAFGAAEAARTGSLFGWTVELRSPAAAEAERADIDALILGVAGPSPRGDVPVLRLVCDPAGEHDGSFTLASCDGDTADLWQPTLERFGAGQLNDRFRSATGTAMTGDAWLAWFAFKVLAESAMRTDSTAPAELVRHLADPATHFDGHKGEPLRFGKGRRLVQPTYRRSERARP